MSLIAQFCSEQGARLGACEDCGLVMTFCMDFAHSSQRKSAWRRRRTMSHTDTSSGIQTVTGDTFSLVVLMGAGPIAVEFMSYGCSHCRAIEPALQQVAVILKSREKIVRVNTATEQGLAEQYQIRGTPTLVMFLDGTIVGRIEGPNPDVSSVLSAIRQPYEN